MAFLIPELLETARLRLRTVKEDDWSVLHEYYSDEESTRYTTLQPLSEEESRRTVTSMGRHWERHGYGPYAHGPWGFGFFGILFGIFLLFLVVGLLRAAFGGHHRGGPGGWGRRREMLEEMHRDLHRRDAGNGGTQASGA